MSTQFTGAATNAVLRPPAPVVLDVDGLRKAYGPKAVLHGLSLQVRQGEVVGLVGPNGAGKTTFLECVEGIRAADAGTVRICGVPPSAGAMHYHRLFGAQLQESSLPDRLRVREALRLFAGFYRHPWDVDDLLARVGLTEQAKVFYRRLSGGQKRRLVLALALVGRPPVLLLDEPSSGLDPHAKLELWDVLRRLADGRTAVLLATHDLHEAQDRCDRVCMVDRGRVVADGAVEELLRGAGLITRIRTADHPALAPLVRQVPGFVGDQVVAGTYFGYGDPGFGRAAVAALEQAARADVRPPGIERVLAAAAIGPAGLEDLYLTRTGAQYREDGHARY
jgi:ABC-2 type transport system ATP-binding protein